MGLQWTAVALFLYAEIAFILILCLPLLSAQRWQKIFKWQIWSMMSSYWNKFFFAMIIILVVLFLDAVREVRKYSAEETTSDPQAQSHPNFHDHVHMMLFRAQRNLYLSGFSLFQWLVIRRIITLIHQVALAQGSGAALQTQAEGANEAAQKYMAENQKLKEALKDEASAKSSRSRLMREEVEKATKDLRAADDALRRSRAEIQAVKKQAQGFTKDYGQLLKEHHSTALQKSRVEVEAMKKQTQGLTKEYDRLLKEHQMLQESASNGPEGKKDQ